MRPFTLATEDFSAEKVFGQNLAMTFGRKQLFLFQFTKLLNYFSDDLVPELGGTYIPSEERASAPEAAEKFLRLALSFEETNGNNWITKRHKTQPWSESNLKVVNVADPELGAPYEAYLTYDGAMVTVNQASRILCIDPGTLVQLKLSLWYDELVVLEAIKRMLRPRSQWPRIVAHKGGKGRSFRFGSKH